MNSFCSRYSRVSTRYNSMAADNELLRDRFQHSWACHGANNRGCGSPRGLSSRIRTILMLWPIFLAAHSFLLVALTIPSFTLRLLCPVIDLYSFLAIHTFAACSALTACSLILVDIVVVFAFVLSAYPRSLGPEVQVYEIFKTTSNGLLRPP